MTRRLRKPKEGFDGAMLHVRNRQIPGTRQVQETLTRSRPGTFEWRYGRASPGTELDMLYHAGVEFARLWERAGLDGPGSVDWAKGSRSPWRGLPLNRVLAMDEVRLMTQELGKLVTARLTQYAVQGHTARQIAAAYGDSERATSIVLAADLKAAAVYFRYEERG